MEDLTQKLKSSTMNSGDSANENCNLIQDFDLKFELCEKNGNFIEDIPELNITQIEFNKDGNYLAVGDYNGNIAIFKQNSANYRNGYEFYLYFVSHQSEYDCLRSIVIEPGINCIKWLKLETENAKCMLTCNDKTIKCWKISKSYEKFHKNTINNEEINELKLPIRITAKYPREKLFNVYARAHPFCINSLSLNSDNETFLSADDLKIHLWNLEVNHTCFNVVNWHSSDPFYNYNKVINCCEFHPTKCNLFLYGDSNGKTHLCDLRKYSICDESVSVFGKHHMNPGVSKRICYYGPYKSVDSISFLNNNDDQFITRQNFTTYLWDIRNNEKPLEMFQIQDFIKSKNSIDNESTDRFQCKTNFNNTSIITGGYNNTFEIIDINKKKILTYGLNSNNIPGSTLKPLHILDRLSPSDGLDDDKKILYAAAHPKDNIFAFVHNNQKLSIIQGPEYSNV